MKYRDLNISFTIENTRFTILSLVSDKLIHPIPMHAHSKNSYELHYISSGEGMLNSGGVRYRILPGTVFMTGPGVEYDTMPFGFENHLIFGSINFRQCHMERAIELLAKSRYNEIVSLIDRDEFAADPIGAYKNKIYSKGAPMKTAVIWNKNYIDI